MLFVLRGVVGQQGSGLEEVGAGAPVARRSSRRLVLTQPRPDVPPPPADVDTASASAGV
jgi:hypothetical protein